MPRPRAYDFTVFDRLIRGLQNWRERDMDNNMLLTREHIVAIIDGVAALRKQLEDQDG